MLTRRSLLQTGAALGLLGATPSRLAHAVSGRDRRFLFVFCEGGWDTTRVFTPTFDHPDLPSEEGAWVEEAGGIAHVASDSRQSVTRFFADHGPRTVVLNGLEVASIAHARCEQILLTGRAEAGRDDWPALLGGAADHLLLPSLIASGPSYATEFSSSVVRLGDTGQLSALLDGSGLQSAAQPVSPPSRAVADLIDAQVARQAAAFTDRAADARAVEVGNAAEQALDELTDLLGLAGDLDLSVDASREFVQQATPLLTALSQGLARCGVIRHLGVNQTGWDSHNLNDMHQSAHFNLLFADLKLLMEALDSLPGVAGGSLADETTVVVISEMGRAPWYNVQDGKDHWTWTSAMLVGGGIQGGRVIGATDGAGVGVPVDPSSGDATSRGEHLTAAHLGATLLALGDVDPDATLPGVTPLAL